MYKGVTNTVAVSLQTESYLHLYLKLLKFEKSRRGGLVYDGFRDFILSVILSLNRSDYISCLHKLYKKMTALP
jgi:hypothetical protein